MKSIGARIYHWDFCVLFLQVRQGSALGYNHRTAAVDAGADVRRLQIQRRRRVVEGECSGVGFRV